MLSKGMVGCGIAVQCKSVCIFSKIAVTTSCREPTSVSLLAVVQPSEEKIDGLSVYQGTASFC